MRNRRSLSLAIGTALVMGACSADAIVIDGAEIGPVADSFTWTSDTAKYQSYAQGCGLTSCGSTSVPTISANGDILFFWGTEGATTNSKTTWSYSTAALTYAQPLNLQYVALTSTGQAGTSGIQYMADGTTVVGPRLIGTGLTGTWPVDNGTGGLQGNTNADTTPISNALITITANGATVGVTGAQIETSRPPGLDATSTFQVGIGLGQNQPADPTTPWVMRAQGPIDADQNVVGYVQMPVSQAFQINAGLGKELKNGDNVQLILSEQVAHNKYPDFNTGPNIGPSAMLARTDVQLVGTYVASVLGVNNPASVNLGLSRIGQTSGTATGNATATNTKVSTTGTTVLYNVEFGKATTDITTRGAFSPTDPATGGNLAEGVSAARDYTYHATDFGPNTGTVTVGAITGVNADGTPYTGTAANTQQVVTLQATGVGPVFDFSGKDVKDKDLGCNFVGPSGKKVCGVVDLGTLDPTHTTITTLLTIANLFDATGLNLTALGDLASLTLINVGFGPTYTQSVQVGTGLFSLSSMLSGTVLYPALKGADSTTTDLTLTATASPTGFVTTLYLLTDANAENGFGPTNAGRQFLFDIKGSWFEAPAPGTLALLALGLAVVRLGRRPTARYAGT